MRKAILPLISLVCALVFVEPMVAKSSGTELTNTSVAETRMAELQDKFWRLAMAMDAVRIIGLQEYPKPDWLIRHDRDAFDSAYAEAIVTMNAHRKDEALATRINGTRASYHFDVLALYPMNATADESSQVGMTSDTLKLIRAGRLQKDPFAPQLNLGYIATYSDFMLISVGPDGRSDILEFGHSISGEYMLQNKAENRTVYEQVRDLGKGRLAGDGYLQKIAVNPDAIYDPTNGLLSNGDIIFHRRGGDGFMYSYRPDLPLAPDIFIKRRLQSW